MLANVLLAALLLVFLAWNFAQIPIADWLNFELFLLSVATLALAGLALCRPAPRRVDMRWRTQAICWISTVYVLLFERVPIPEAVWLVELARWSRVIFHSLAMIGLIMLGRSYSLLPALRDVQDRYLYRWVRHPVYMSYIVADAAFLVLQFSWWNLALAWFAAMLFVERARLEEELLVQDEAYRAYQKRVPYRFIPFVV